MSSLGYLLLGSTITIVWIWLIIFYRQGFLTNRDWLVMLTPIFVLTGYILMNHQLEAGPMAGLLESKTMGTIEGRIDQIIQTPKSYRVYLNSVQVTLNQNNADSSHSGTKEVEIKEIVTKQDDLKEDELKENNTKTDNINTDNTKTDDIKTVDKKNGETKKVYHMNKILVYTTKGDQLQVGFQIRVYGQISEFLRASNPGQFDEYQFYKSQNIDYKVYETTLQVTDTSYSGIVALLRSFKEKLILVYQKVLSEKEAGIISAMILGESYLMDQDTKELYQENGIAHILAISGLHITLIGMCFYRIFQKMKLHLYLCIALTMVLIILYGIMTNFSVSTNRAVVMLIIALSARVLGRTYDVMSALSLSALIILVQSPLQLYSCGFLLSFSAVVGIAVIMPILNMDKQESSREQVEGIGFLIALKENITENVTQSLLVSFSVTVMILPILLYYFYLFPLYSILLNVLVVPFMTLATMLSISGGICGMVSIYASEFLMGAVHYSLVFCEKLCELFQLLPYSSIITGKPSIFLICCYYLLLSLFLYIRTQSESKKQFLILMGLCVIFLRFKNYDLKITFLDVGQGDGIVFETPSGRTYLIDGGSSDISDVGTYRLMPFLKSEGISRLDYAIVTHTDQDHISGLLTLLEESQVKHLILPKTSSITEAYENLLLLAKKKEVEILYIEKGDLITDQTVTLSCLHPYNNYQSDSLNDCSTVLSFSYDGFDVLFTGDLEMKGEKEIQRALKDCDLLKVAHHGSKYSTGDDFLDTVDPEYALISCGRNNRYGHPHQELLGRLFDVGCRTYITSQQGAITVLVKNGEAQIFKYLED